MTLLGSFILTSGIYFGFSCFDCFGRWSSRKYALSTAALPEVRTHFLSHTSRYKLLKELFNIVRNK
jgi:hypothetical protein